MIEILSGGLQTTVQDGGRFGHQSMGVPVCGAMDELALCRANILCGNPWHEAALEFCALGPTIRFDEAAVFAYCGGGFDAALDGAPVASGQAVLAQRGSVLTLGAAQRGFRGVLAFAGGLELPEVMGSRSTCLAAHFGGYEGRRLQAGDRLTLRAPQLWLRGLPRRRLAQRYALSSPVRVVVGAQSDALSAHGLKTFFSSAYRVSAKSDRMGLRLEGPALEFAAGRDANILSDGVAMGAVQVPDGRPIVMMADRQTVGGYAKLGAVCTVDLPLLAQKRPGEEVHFAPVGIAEAQALLRARHRMLFAEQSGLDWAEIW